MSSSVNIFVVTWNVGNADASDAATDALLDFSGLAPDQYPDVVMVGFQEVDGSLSNNFTQYLSYSGWSVKIMERMCSHGFIMLRHDTFPGILSLMFVNYTWLPFVNRVEVDTTKLMFESLVGSKGAIGLHAEIGNRQFCFINSHLPAHLADHVERDRAYLTILADQFYATSQLTVLNHDYVFWYGDLNFRIDHIPNQEIKRLIQEGEFSLLLQNDQLSRSMASGRSFAAFQEGKIEFAPTYKFNVGTQEYDSSEKRRKPAWCDRVLWRDRPEVKLQGLHSSVSCNLYRSAPSCCASDHKPVQAAFTVTLDHFQCSQIISMIPVHDTLKNCFTIKILIKREKDAEDFKPDNSDYIGIYREKAVKLKDYVTSKPVTAKEWEKGRVKIESKHFPEKPGNYRAIFHSSKFKSAIAVSKIFSVE